MGRVSKEQMEHNRKNIIKASSELFRQRGLDGVSVNDIMSAVGLTHGGFYGHFSSKDELEALACRQAFDDTDAFLDQGDMGSFAQLVEYYLSTEHRDNTRSGCTVSALASDVLRKDREKPVRETYKAGVKKMAERLAAIEEDKPDTAPADKHLTQLALMAGALMLARATEGDEISERFLSAAKTALLGTK
ncbi:MULTISPECIES: TetR/AcrR family transcriptional regulator [Serratia]|uniref:TetR/AcrR family transcriptional regulator n=1 Tax=Serratia TaxID=613 RepID=UPI000CF6EDDF|nr:MULTISPECIES: TetR/AcrR family transcriptional regulator [Serratia]AVJ17787.1 TetR family transcriptional regulator [Serratia sp. MYb239]MEB6336158.1 TetR/AcrR family transcriptional regulator [Serratia rhizosphaerae]